MPPDIAPGSTPNPTGGVPFNGLPEPEIASPLEPELPLEPVEHVDDVGTEPSAAEGEAEVEARRYGWVPREEWGGAPERWRPASEFMDVRNNVLSITRDENRRLRAELASLRGKVEGKEKTDTEARIAFTRESLRRELKQAQEEGDWDKASQVTEKILDLKLGTAAQPKAPAIDPSVQETFNEFVHGVNGVGGNAWLERDKELQTDFAVELKAVVEANPAVDMLTALNHAKRRVMKMNPEKFRNGARRPAMVDMGGTGAVVGGRAWANLKPEFRGREIERDIAEKKYTREEYLANCDRDAFRS